MRPCVRVHVGVVHPVQLLDEGLPAELAVEGLLLVRRVHRKDVELVLALAAEGLATLSAQVVAVVLVREKAKNQYTFKIMGLCHRIRKERLNTYLLVPLQTALALELRAADFAFDVVGAVDDLQVLV